MPDEQAKREARLATELLDGDGMVLVVRVVRGGTRATTHARGDNLSMPVAAQMYAVARRELEGSVAIMDRQFPGFADLVREVGGLLSPYGDEGHSLAMFGPADPKGGGDCSIRKGGRDGEEAS